MESKYHNPYATGRRSEIKLLYVAGPMTGYTECNYPAFNAAAADLRAHGYSVVNPVDVNPPEHCHYVDLLREDLRAMIDCDGVATLEGWWESAGARNEVQVAGLLRMPVRSVTEWLDRQ